MVHEGEAVLLLLVVGHGVLTVAVVVVATAIFIAVVADGGGEGERGVGEGLGVEDGVFVAGRGGVTYIYTFKCISLDRDLNVSLYGIG